MLAKQAKCAGEKQIEIHSEIQINIQIQILIDTASWPNKPNGPGKYKLKYCPILLRKQRYFRNKDL